MGTSGDFYLILSVARSEMLLVDAFQSHVDGSKSKNQIITLLSNKHKREREREPECMVAFSRNKYSWMGNHEEGANSRKGDKEGHG